MTWTKLLGSHDVQRHRTSKKELDDMRALVARDLARQGKIADGFRLVTNNGRGAGQTVPHIHYHLLAGRRLTWPPG